MIQVDVSNKHTTGTRNRAGMTFTRGNPVQIDEKTLRKDQIIALKNDEYLVVTVLTGEALEKAKAKAEAEAKAKAEHKEEDKN